jgi:hypothetical protein
MVDAVVDDHLLHLERIDALQASDVEAEFAGVGAALVMGVDATSRAEEVLRRIRVELIDAKPIRTFEDPEAALRCCGDDRSTSPAHRTIAVSRIDQTVR